MRKTISRLLPVFISSILFLPSSQAGKLSLGPSLSETLIHRPAALVCKAGSVCYSIATTSVETITSLAKVVSSNAFQNLKVNLDSGIIALGRKQPPLVRIHTSISFPKESAEQLAECIRHICTSMIGDTTQVDVLYAKDDIRITLSYINEEPNSTEALPIAYFKIYEVSNQLEVSLMLDQSAYQEVRKFFNKSSVPDEMLDETLVNYFKNFAEGFIPSIQ